MPREVRLVELLIGIEGLALLRHLYDGTDDAARERLEEISRLLDDDALAVGEPIGERDPRAGYAAWSETYDDLGNQIVALEQSIVWEMLGRLRPGVALDAACGTGRHARRLIELGHQVLGIDVTSEMLARAAAAVPGASFLEGDLREVPVADEHFDVIVCGLALSHLPELEPGVSELARVLKPGGTLIVSTLHPFQAMLGWHAPFSDADGRRHFVREYPHSHSDFMNSFACARLTVRACVEPRLTHEQLPAKRRAYKHIPEATAQAYLGLPAVLVWELEKA